MQRETELRLCEETQAAFGAAEASGDSDWMEVTVGLQRRVLREFGCVDDEAGLAALRAAAQRHPDAAPQVRFNRARPGALSAGDAAPDVPLYDAHTREHTTLHAALLAEGPAELVCIAAGSYS